MAAAGKQISFLLETFISLAPCSFWKQNFLVCLAHLKFFFWLTEKLVKP